MMSRHVILTLATCAALPFSAFVLGGCGTTATVVPPPVNINTGGQQVAPPMVPVAQPMMVSAAWTPGGVYDEISNNMALRARQFAAGFGVATELMRATIRQGMEGVMVPGQVQSGYCYRIIAVGDRGVGDLDLFLYQNGQQVDADRAPDNYPVIGLNRPLCVPPGLPPIAAQLRIRSYRGAGAIGVQMFAQPFNGQQVMAQPVMAQPMVGAPGVVYR